MTLLPAGSAKAAAARKVRVVRDADPAVSGAVVNHGSGVYRVSGARPACAAPVCANVWGSTQHVQTIPRGWLESGSGLGLGLGLGLQLG